MNTSTLGTALKNKIGKVQDYLTGTTKVNGGMKPTIKSPVVPFKSTLPKQEVYGVPGINKKSQLK